MAEISSTRRILSASFASWTGIFLAVVIQILAVPIYLHYWGTDTYGLWLILLSIWAIFIIPYNSFLIFVGFDVIKLAQNKNEVNQIMSSVLIVALLLCLMIFAMCLFFAVKGFGDFLSINSEESHLLGLLLCIYSLGWLVSGSVHGILEKWSIPYGFNPYFAWFKVVRVSSTYVAALIFIFSGHDIYTTVVAMVGTDIVTHYISFYLLSRKFKNTGISWSWDYSISQGLYYLKKSLWLMVKYLLDSLRTVGIRFLLAHDLPTAKIALFSTLRTPANMVYQGVNSITFAIQPELMSSIRDKELNKVYLFNTVLWFALSILIIPSTILLQHIMPMIYDFWTSGKLVYDPMIFAIFLMTALVYAIYSPLEAIVKGNNLAARQAIISFSSIVLLIFFLSILTPIYGLIGVAYSLFVSEVMVLCLYAYFAIVWMKENEFNVPGRAFFLVLLNFLSSVLVFLDIGSGMPNIYMSFLGGFFSLGVGFYIWCNYPKGLRDKINRRVRGKFMHAN